MKLTELIINQKLIIQLNWGERKIEFFSEVLEKEASEIFVTPYLHNGSALELNVTRDKGVICNVFADNPVTNKRVSWKNVELTTVSRNRRMLYCLKTYGFNHIASLDDRRLHERVIVDVDAELFDDSSDIGERVVVHDISDIGISFIANESYIPKSQQVVATFSDTIGTRTFSVRVEGSITRVTKEDGHAIVGCRVIGESKEYQLYGLMKRLSEKNGKKMSETDGGVMSSEENNE